MHISLSLSLLLTLPLALAFASTPAAPNPIATPTPPGQQLYHLKTRAIGNSSATNSTKDGLYVMAYHNGAGTNEVTLTPYKDSAAKGYLNSSHQQFTLDSFNTPFSFYLGGDDDWASWQLVHINAGFGDYTGWYFDKNGALVVGSSEFNGWLGGITLEGINTHFHERVATRMKTSEICNTMRNLMTH